MGILENMYVNYLMNRNITELSEFKLEDELYFLQHLSNKKTLFGRKKYAVSIKVYSRIQELSVELMNREFVNN